MEQQYASRVKTTPDEPRTPRTILGHGFMPLLTTAASLICILMVDLFASRRLSSRAGCRRRCGPIRILGCSSHETAPPYSTHANPLA